MRKSGFRSVFMMVLVGLLVLVVSPFAACNTTSDEGFESSQSSVVKPSQPSVVKYVVNFESDGGTPVSSQMVIAGEKVKKPADPVKASTPTEEYTFIGWFVGDEVWDFESDTVTSDLSLIAKYSVKKSTIQYQ